MKIIYTKFLLFLIQKKFNWNKSNHLTEAILISICIFFTNTEIYAQETSILWRNPIDMTQISTSTNALFPVILCDQYQNTHILWADRNNFSTMYYISDALGDWSAPIDVITNSDSNHLMIRLSAVIDDTNDVMHVLWVDQWIKGALHYSQVPLSNGKNPRAWTEPLTLAIGTENGAIDVDKAGNLHVVYGVSGADNIDVGIEYIRSNDHGNTWTIPRRVFSKKVSFPSDPWAEIAVDGEGRIHVGITLRSQDYGVYSEVGYTKSLDGGLSWSEYELIDDLGTASQGVSTSSPYAFGDDEIHLTWHDPRRMHRWSSDGGSTWSEPSEVMQLGAAFGGPNALTKDSAGMIHIVMAINGGVYSASWDGGIWGPPERIEDREIDIHGQGITICQGNNLQVVYDDRNDSQKIWYSNRIVDAPRIKQQTIVSVVQPTEDSGFSISPIEIPDANSSSTGQSSPTSHGPIQFQDNSDQSLANPLTPLMVASGIVLALILVIIIIKRR